MASPTPTTDHILTPEERLAHEQKARYDRITHNIAIGGIIACPVIALLPPRKLDLYTFSLGVGFYLSADRLAVSYNGRPLLEQYQWKMPNPVGVSLPTEKAEQTRQALKEEREEADRLRREREGLKARTAEERRGFWQRVWYGGESENWKEKRMEEERRAMEEGKSYQDIIFEQIWEVWNWDIKKEGGKDDDEKKK
jgi:hypothetical protein